MTIHDFLAPVSVACQRTGPSDHIVMSSRVRLARNLRKQPFPAWAKKSDRLRVLEMVKPAVESLPQLSPHFAAAMDELSPLDKQILVERHLISREHAAKGAAEGAGAQDADLHGGRC